MNFGLQIGIMNYRQIIGDYRWELWITDSELGITDKKLWTTDREFGITDKELWITDRELGITDRNYELLIKV